MRKQAEDGPRPAHQLLPALAFSDASLLADDQLTDRDRFVRAMAERVRSDVMSLCGQYGALNEVLAEAREQLGCDDVLDPDLRERLVRAEATLATAGEHAVAFVGKLDTEMVDGATKDSLWERIRDAGRS